jgi:hypothetical protein
MSLCAKKAPSTVNRLASCAIVRGDSPPAAHIAARQGARARRPGATAVPQASPTSSSARNAVENRTAPCFVTSLRAWHQQLCEDARGRTLPEGRPRRERRRTQGIAVAIHDGSGRLRFLNAQCGHIMLLKKGQLLQPCPRCGGAMEKYEGPAATKKDSGCA